MRYVCICMCDSPTKPLPLTQGWKKCKCFGEILNWLCFFFSLLAPSSPFCKTACLFVCTTPPSDQTDSPSSSMFCLFVLKSFNRVLNIHKESSYTAGSSVIVTVTVPQRCSHWPFTCLSPVLIGPSLCLSPVLIGPLLVLL